jgi:hypothetical protein
MTWLADLHRRRQGRHTDSSQIARLATTASEDGVMQHAIELAMAMEQSQRLLSKWDRMWCVSAVLTGLSVSGTSGRMCARSWHAGGVSTTLQAHAHTASHSWSQVQAKIRRARASPRTCPAVPLVRTRCECLHVRLCVQRSVQQQNCFISHNK